MGTFSLPLTYWLAMGLRRTHFSWHAGAAANTGNADDGFGGEHQDAFDADMAAVGQRMLATSADRRRHTVAMAAPQVRYQTICCTHTMVALQHSKATVL